MIHDVKDTDTHFIIDGASRTVKNESDVKSMLVQYDHNSEQFSFKVPREFDNHDLSLCNTVRVHFINVDRTKRMENKGFNTVTETLHICPDDDNYVICSWLIPREATQLVGILCFVIQFACIEDDKVLYSWNTAKYSGVTIAEGINADEEVANEYTEILTQWENELKANQITKIEQTTVSTEDDGVNVWTATFGDGRTQDFKVKNGSKGSTGLIGSIQTIQGYPLHFFVGTQAEYDELKELTPEQTKNLFAIITDDTEANDLKALKKSVALSIDNARTHALDGKNIFELSVIHKNGYSTSKTSPIFYKKVDVVCSGSIGSSNISIPDIPDILDKGNVTITVECERNTQGSITVNIEDIFGITHSGTLTLIPAF